MNLANLQTFLVVVQMGNLNKAAERLNITQSTVTARLDALEDFLGQRLLVRARRGTQLTKAGLAFQRHAELIVQTWDLARKRVGLPKGFSGLFSFACIHDLWEGLGARMVDELLEERPALAVEAWQGEPGEIHRWLSSGLVDAALTSEPLAGPGLAFARIGYDRLVQVANVRRALMAWDPTYIFVDLGAEFRRAHALAWPVDDTPRISFASSRWALDHLLARGGSAYLPWRMVEPHMEERLFLVEDAPEFERPLHLVWREAALDNHPWVARLAGGNFGSAIRRNRSQAADAGFPDPTKR